MASYVLKHSRTSLTGITSTTYSTVTDLLTVTSGHLYIIKSLKAVVNFASTGGTIGGAGLYLSITDNAGANSITFTGFPYVTSAAGVSNAFVQFDWTAGSAVDPNTAPAFTSHRQTQAITSSTVYRIASNEMKDIHLEAGQILKLVPTDNTLASAWSIATSVSASILVEISYIDYTL